MYAVQDFGHKSASAIRCASLACLSLGLSSRSTGIATRDFDADTLALLLSFYLSGSGFCLSTFFPIRPFGFHPSLFLPFSYSTFCLSPREAHVSRLSDGQLDLSPDLLTPSLPPLLPSSSPAAACLAPASRDGWIPLLPAISFSPDLPLMRKRKEVLCLRKGAHDGVSGRRRSCTRVGAWVLVTQGDQEKGTVIR